MKKVIILGLMTALFLSGCGKGENMKILTVEEAKAKAEAFINDELIAGGADTTKAAISEVTEENGLYKLKVVVKSGENEQEVDSFMTRDGKKFFTQGIDMDVEKKTDEQVAINKQPEVEVSKKQDKPRVEIFVMSHCPYGTQIEKGILPVIKLLGDKIDFELKFCDYAMHGKTEVDEQLKQFCISKEEPEKLIEYLECFLDEGKTTGCLAKAKINQSKLNSCVAKTDKEFEIIKNLEDKESWYNGRFPQFNIFKEDVTKYEIKGSPALVINGEKIAAARDAQALLSIICSSFNSAPEECNETLSSSAPSPGFGFGETGASSDGSCN